MRTKKTVGGVQYDYYYVDGQLRYEKKGSEYELYYRYGLDGNLVSVTRYNLTSSQSETYYAITNIFGDVIELRSDSGDVYAKYVYDSWGKLVSITNSSGTAITDSSNIAVQNSIRYRGYVYDTETGLYYLQSRYYDPEIGRFLNADDVDLLGTSGTVLGYNAFAYCENEPVCRRDVGGLSFEYAFGKALQYSIMLQILTDFLKIHLKIKKIVEFKSLSEDYRTGIFKCKVKYKITSNHNLTVKFGDQEAWYKRCDFNNVTNFTFTNRVSDFSVFAYENIGDPDYSINVMYTLLVAAITAITLTYMNGEYTALRSQRVYNKVWGKYGIDPADVYGYYVFEVSNAENDNNGVLMNGYHAFSEVIKDGEVIDI